MQYLLVSPRVCIYTFISQVPLTQILYFLWAFAWFIICQNWNFRSRDEWQGAYLSWELSSKICCFISTPVSLSTFQGIIGNLICNRLVKINWYISFLTSDTTPLVWPRDLTCWCCAFCEITWVSSAYILMLCLFRWKTILYTTNQSV